MKDNTEAIRWFGDAGSLHKGEIKIIGRAKPEVLAEENH